MTEPSDFAPVRSTQFTLLMVIVVCFATAFILATPGFVLLMSSHWGYGGRQLGMFVTADSIGSAAGPLLLSGVLSRMPVRRIIVTSALGFAAGNLMTAMHPEFEWMLVSRALAGTSSGLLAGLGVRYLALAASSERNLAWMTIGQTLYSTLVLTVVLPVVGANWHAAGAFVVLAVQGLLCLPLFKLFKPGEIPTGGPQGGGVVHRAGSLLCLMAILSLNTAVGVVWTFIGYQGQAAGLSDVFVDRVLGASNVLSIAGCACVPFAVRSGHVFAWTVGALGICTAAALALSQTPGAGLFILSSLIYVFAWAAAITLLMAILPSYDTVGRYVMLIPTALCVGNGVGAAIGGNLMEVLSAGHAFVFAAGCCAISAMFILVLRNVASSPAPLPDGSAAR